MEAQIIAKGKDFEHIVVTADGGVNTITIMQEKDGTLLVFRQDSDGDDILVTKIPLSLIPNT